MATSEKKEPKFTKQALIHASEFSGHSEVLAVILKEKEYTVEQVRGELKKFYAKEAK